MNDAPLLVSVENLSTHFFSKEGTVKAIDGVSFDVRRGESLGIAGESGCGKSVTAQSILRIVPRNGRIVNGRITLHRADGDLDLTTLDPTGPEIRSIRGKEISMIFQEPMTSFSPVHSIGNQIIEVIRLHQNVDAKEGRNRAVEMLRAVGMPKPEQTIDAYSFALSGGQRQRAMIAMALACNPSLLIADEPTTAVDVTIQAQVLDLVKDLQTRMTMAMIIITHDLAVIAEVCERVVIMYLGHDVERGTVEEVFEKPLHPYTEGLLNSVPRLGEGSTQKIDAVRGVVPSVYELPAGCPFHPRCKYAIDGVCDRISPPRVEVSPGRHVMCHLYGDGTGEKEE
ncbi:MAG: ABC transporter ATP-binding protein [Spirochaetaceae bacterium]|nr:MAG: ABC transporter ATP-binding protein [Spirochaetaceae bacterium]